GIFQRARLFRIFGIIVSFLIAVHLGIWRVAPLSAQIISGQPHRDAQLSLVLLAIAVVLYMNSHVLARRWKELFSDDAEELAMSVVSYVGGAMAVVAAYAYVPDKTVAVVLALFITWLSATGKLFVIDELIYQAHIVAAVAFVQVIVADRDLTALWLG